MAQLLADGTKQITFTREQFNDVNDVLERIFKQTKALTVMLADASGLLIGQQGTMDTNNLSVLTALAAANHAATKEMAKFLGEAGGFKNNFYQGEDSNIYVTGVGDNYFVVVVFSKETTFGMVKVQTDRSIPELIEVTGRSETAESVQEQGAEMQESLDDDEFRDELSSRLDDVLFKN